MWYLNYINIFEINYNLTFCSVLDEPTYDDLESSNVSMCSGSVNEILDQVGQAFKTQNFL